MTNSIVAIALLGLWGTSCLAAAVDAGASDASLEEIIVTAEKVSGNVQSIPIAISAFDGSELTAEGITNSLQLQFKDPSVTFTRSGSNNQIFIRGIGTLVNPYGADSSVGFFVDGVYRPRARDQLTDFLDVARVEVLKGPQVALYGRNATGGAINVISRRPEPDFEASVEATFGNFDYRRYAGVLNVPIVGEKLLFRAAAQTVRQAGTTDNLFPGAAVTELGNADANFVRAQVLAQPVEQFSFLAILDYYHDRRTSASHQDPRYPNLEVRRGGNLSTDPREVYFDNYPQPDVKNGGIVTQSTWTVSDRLEFANNLAFRRSEGLESGDFDGTDYPSILFAEPIPFPGRGATQEDRSDVVSEELIANFRPNDRTEALFGLYYFQEDVDVEYFISTSVSAPLFNIKVRDFKTRAYSGYGQLKYQLSERWRATVGARYSTEEKSFLNQTTAYPKVGAPPLVVDFSRPIALPELSLTNDWSAFTPRGVLEFEPTPNVLAYFSVSDGFKSGGFDTTSPGNPPFDQESVLAYELGLKSTLLDGRVRANAALFKYDYKDLQVQLTAATGLPFVTNAADAKINGAELSLDVAPIRGLLFAASATLLDAEYEDFPARDEFTGQVVNIAGNEMARAPKLSAGIRGEYAWGLGDFGTLTTRGDWSYRAKTEFDVFNRREGTRPAYDLINASIGWRSASERYEINLFGRNLTDQLYDVARGVNVRVGDLSASDTWGDPRMWGVTLRVQM